MTRQLDNDLPLCPWCDSPARISESISIGCSNISSCPTRPKVFSSDLDTARAKWAHRTRSVNLEQMTFEELQSLIEAAHARLVVVSNAPTVELRRCAGCNDVLTMNELDFCKHCSSEAA